MLLHRMHELEYTGQPFGRPDTVLLPDAAAGFRYATIAYETAQVVNLGADAVTVSNLPGGLVFYAGYVTGIYNNYNAIVAAFPGKKYAGISTTVAPTDVYDIEPGGGTTADAGAFYDQSTHPNLGLPAFYASAGDVQSVIDALTAAGKTRASYYIWSAHWIGEHICAPSVCGYPQADGTQYASNGYDSDAFYSYMFKGATPVPPTPPIPTAQPLWAWCSKCQGLYYHPGESASKCPDGGTHSGNSYNYVLPVNGAIVAPK
jgi:hypothetical protein